MIADALKFLNEQAQAACAAKTKVEILKLPGEDEGNFAVVKPDGQLELHTSRRKARRSTLASIDEVRGYCEWLIETHEGAPVVWYDQKSVIIVHDDASIAGDRRDCTTLLLALTPQFAELREIAKAPPAFTQRDFVRLLRVKFSDCLTESSEDLLRLVRVLDFKNFVTAHGTVDHGRQSLGREIEQEVISAGGSLPEEITLSVRVFNDRALRAPVPIRLAVEIDPGTQRFALSPLAGELDRVIDDQLQIVQRLIACSGEEGLGYEIFHGTP